MLHVFQIYLLNISFRQSIKLRENQYIFTVTVLQQWVPTLLQRCDIKLQNLKKMYLQYKMVLQTVKHNLH